MEIIEGVNEPKDRTEANFILKNRKKRVFFYFLIVGHTPLYVGT